MNNQVIVRDEVFDLSLEKFWEISQIFRAHTVWVDIKNPSQPISGLFIFVPIAKCRLLITSKRWTYKFLKKKILENASEALEKLIFTQKNLRNDSIFKIKRLSPVCTPPEILYGKISHD